MGKQHQAMMEDAANSPWACFGQWLEICTTLADGDISRADLTLWAKWFGDGLSPFDAACLYLGGD
jgi:hypothetical protein